VSELRLGFALPASLFVGKFEGVVGKLEVILGADLFGGQVVNALLYRFGS